MPRPLLEPWTEVSDFAANLEAELHRELSEHHPLFRAKAIAVAQRTDTDDVLFQIQGDKPRYAVVHLTWRGEKETDARWPETHYFETIEDWEERGMQPDHKQYIGE